jgi:predicted secreted protein
MITSISTALAIYFVLWWVVLFAILPFGVTSQAEQGEGAGHEAVPGTDPGAPVKARMLRKMAWTTLISAAIYGLAMAAYAAGYLNIERLAKLMGFPL